jgi:RHS repeat-associated protein
LGNRLTQKDANGHTTSFEYDKLGRQSARILPDGKRETMEYDLAGNLIRKVDFAGRVTELGYDINNRLLTRTYPASPSENVSFTYYPSGRLKTATVVCGASTCTTTYNYDARDRMTSVIEPDGSRVELEWDANGNRIRVAAVPTVGSPISTSFTYDDASRLDLITDAANQDYHLSYDNVGNRTSLAHPNGVTTTYVYNDLNRLRNLTSTGTVGTVQSYDLTLGATGNRTRIVEHTGRTRDFDYDKLYRLIQDKVTNTIGGAVLRQEDLAYDRVGNRTTRTLTDASGTPTTTTYTYDDRDRLLTENITNYGWDANGNLITKSGEATYTWDTENRLIKVTKTDGTVVDNAYDAFGTLLQTKTTKAGQPEIVATHLIDRSRGLTHALADLDVSGVATSLYVRADDELVAILRPNGAGSHATKHVHSDYIGSIRALTDADGNVTDTYEYDAWGNLLNRTGTDPQSYAFAGEPHDPNIGFQYHRARWMDTGTGTFVTRDAFVGVYADPPTLHDYVYANDDPVNRVDPTGRFGEFTLGGMMAANAVRSTLAGAQTNVGFGILDAISRGGSAALTGLVVASVLPVGLTAGTVVAAKLFGRLARAARLLKGVGQLVSHPALDELAVIRAGLGEAAPKTLALLQVDDIVKIGQNASGRAITVSVNAISKSHAEIDVLEQLLEEAIAQGVTSGFKRVRLAVDRDLCMACGLFGGVRSVARQVGIEELEVVTPNLHTVLKVLVD